MSKTREVQVKKFSERIAEKKGFVVRGSGKVCELYTNDYSAAEDALDKMRRVDCTAEIFFGTPGNWKELDGIKVEGHRGTWYVIDASDCPILKHTVFLLEHEQFGDEAAGLIVDEDFRVVLDDVWNGFDDLAEEIGEWRTEAEA